MLSTTCSEKIIRWVLCKRKTLGLVTNTRPKQDGGIHYHVFLHFEGNGFNTRDPRIFDVDTYHPNIQLISRTPWLAYDYTGKDGDIVSSDCERPAEPPAGETGGKKSRGASTWGDIILAPTRDEFFERVAANDPRALACSFSSIQAYANWKYRSDAAPYETPAGIHTDTSEYPVIGDWVNDYLGQGYEDVLPPVVQLPGGSQSVAPSQLSGMGACPDASPILPPSSLPASPDDWELVLANDAVEEVTMVPNQWTRRALEQVGKKLELL